MDMEYTHKRMGLNMKECGQMDIRMAKAYYIKKMVSLEMGYGKMEKELSGLNEIINKNKK